MHQILPLVELFHEIQYFLSVSSLAFVTYSCSFHTTLSGVVVLIDSIQLVYQLKIIDKFRFPRLSSTYSIEVPFQTIVLVLQIF